MLAALCYSLATVRIAHYASRVPSLDLALGKSALLAVVALCLLGWEAAGAAGALAAAHGAPPTLGELAAQLWPNSGDPLAWALIIYSAVGPGAVAAYLHVKVGLT